MVAHGCRKRKKLICGTEGEIVVAHGRLPSPAQCTIIINLYFHGFFIKGRTRILQSKALDALYIQGKQSCSRIFTFFFKNPIQRDST